MRETQIMMPGEALLATAEREIANGNLKEGAGLVWQATMEALAAAAERYGMPCNNRDEARLFAKYLDAEEPPGPLISHDPGPMAGVMPEDQYFTPAEASTSLNFPRNLAAFRLAESFQEHCAGLGNREGTEYEWEPDEFVFYLEPMRDFIEYLSGWQNQDGIQ